MFFVHEIIVTVILILFRELWVHFKDTIIRITELNRFLQEKSSKDQNGKTIDEKFVDFVKIKMRVLFSQHLSYKVNVTLIILFLSNCFYILVSFLMCVAMGILLLHEAHTNLFQHHQFSRFSLFVKLRNSRANLNQIVGFSGMCVCIHV